MTHFPNISSLLQVVTEFLEWNFFQCSLYLCLSHTITSGERRGKAVSGQRSRVSFVQELSVSHQCLKHGVQCQNIEWHLERMSVGRVCWHCRAKPQKPSEGNDIATSEDCSREGMWQLWGQKWEVSWIKGVWCHIFCPSILNTRGCCILKHGGLRVNTQTQHVAAQGLAVGHG